MNAHKRVLFILVVLLCALLLYSCAQGGAVPTMPRAETALFAYMLADNDLELFALRDVNEMERGVSRSTNNARVPHFAAYMDKKSAAPQHGVVFEIRADTQEHIPSPIVRAYPETNSADPAVFNSVLTYMMRSYSARNSMLVVWSHGTGWVSEGYTPTDAQKRQSTKSFGRDDSSRRAEMSITELAQTLQHLPQRLRVLAFDACYMGDVEVAYELKDAADYLVFSQAEIQHDGFPYDEMVPLLSETSKTIEARLVSSAKAYYEYYNGLDAAVRRTATLSVVRTAQLPDLARAVKDYLAKHGMDSLVNVEQSAQKFSTAAKLSSLRSDMGDLFLRVPQNKEARAVREALKNAVVVSYNTEKLFGAVPLARVHGMSMYVPEAVHGKEVDLRAHYKGLRWAQETGLGDAWN